jgi:hypothetical protein
MTSTSGSCASEDGAGVGAVLPSLGVGPTLSEGGGCSAGGGSWAPAGSASNDTKAVASSTLRIVRSILPPSEPVSCSFFSLLLANVPLPGRTGPRSPNGPLADDARLGKGTQKPTRLNGSEDARREAVKMTQQSSLYNSLVCVGPASLEGLIREFFPQGRRKRPVSRDNERQAPVPRACLRFCQPH